jgi:ABC-2 type transport system permease protein
MLRRVWSVMQKEFIHIARDRRTLLILIGMPMIQLLLFGYAINMNVDHIATMVVDYSLDTASHAYVDAMVTSSFFDVIAYVPSQSALIDAIDEGRAQAGIVIPDGFAADVERGQAQVLLLVDGADLFTSVSAYNAAAVIAQMHATELLMAKVERAGLAVRRGTGQGQGLQSLLPLDTRVRILYNPNLNDLWFIIPGMTAMLLQVQTITLTAAAVVRERERGNIEQILVTPIRPAEFMVGKMLPTGTIALINLLTILAVGVVWFDVPFQGNFWLFLLLALLYVFSGLGLGLLVSTMSQNQKQAHQLVAVTTMVGLMLGGFIFPRYTMPPLLQFAGNLFPLTYFIPISRGIITKGVGLESLWQPVAVLLVYVVVVVTVAARVFKPRLD